jgi:hypothetical protein
MVRPSEVVMFTDGSNEDAPRNPTLLISAYVPTGPFVENFEAAHGRLPHFRHSSKGGLAAAFGDGSARFLRPLRFKYVGGRQCVEQYAPTARVSPYKPGADIRKKFTQP